MCYCQESLGCFFTPCWKDNFQCSSNILAHAIIADHLSWLTVSTWQQKTRRDYDSKIGRPNQQLWPRKAGEGVSLRTDLWKHDWTYAVWGGRWGGSLGWMEFKIHLLARQTSKLADGRSDWLRRDQGVKQKMIMQFWWNSCCTLRQNSFCSPCSYFVRADWHHVLIGGDAEGTRGDILKLSLVRGGSNWHLALCNLKAWWVKCSQG